MAKKKGSKSKWDKTVVRFGNRVDVWERDK